MSAAEYKNLKNFLEHIITSQNKALIESMTEIEMSVKRSEHETQRINRELLDIFGPKTNKCNHLISQIPKRTQVEMTTDNQMLEKNVELINTGATEAVAERQELHIETANLDSVRSVDDRALIRK
jgi:hypothetical protein